MLILTHGFLVYIPYMNQIIVATFYQFTHFGNPGKLCGEVQANLSSYNLTGTVLIAGEGINGTLAGSRTNVDNALEVLRTLPNCRHLLHKESPAKNMPFHRLKIRLKKEIIAMKISDVDPIARVGTYVSPENWNSLITDAETILIDTRNDFEVKIGSFEGAVNPGTANFSEIPHWLDKHHTALEKKKVAMFCTGGIRCEKATSYLKGLGLTNVFHLKGGILNYLEKIPKTESRWQGECFVFDFRVSVKHNLEIGKYELCHACRWPVDDAGRLSSNFVRGISCDNCIDLRSDEQRARYGERQLQMELAKKRGKMHLGANHVVMKQLG